MHPNRVAPTSIFPNPPPYSVDSPPSNSSPLPPPYEERPHQSAVPMRYHLQTDLPVQAAPIMQQPSESQTASIVDESASLESLQLPMQSNINTVGRSSIEPASEFSQLHPARQSERNQNVAPSAEISPFRTTAFVPRTSISASAQPTATSKNCSCCVCKCDFGPPPAVAICIQYFAYLFLYEL